MKKIYSQFNEELYNATLANGLQVFIHPKKGYNSKYAIFATKYGSNDNDFLDLNQKRTKVPAGIAHFLEHKLFDEPEGDVFEDFSALGVSANAYTNYYMTAYLFSGTKNFYPALDRLIDFVQTPYFTDDSVLKEQGIIGQEIMMYDDHPGWRLQRNLLECMYHNHPIRVDIAGTKESISKINKDLLFTCYNTFYHPSNMVLYVTGDIDTKEVLAKIEENQNKKSFERVEPIKRFYPEEPLAVKCSLKEDYMSVAVPLMSLGYKENPSNLSGKQLLQREVLTNLVYHNVLGRSSELFNSLYEQGLISEEFSIGFTGSEDYAYTIMGGPAPKPKELYNRLLDGFKTAQKQGISSEAVNRARRKFAGIYTISYDNLSMIANRYTSYYLKGINFNDYHDILESITVDQVNNRLQECFQQSTHACSIIKPN